jgi:hypothetical protein
LLDTPHKFRRSSAVEQLTVNQLVVGSIPTAGANSPTKSLTIKAQAEFGNHSAAQRCNASSRS